MVIPGQSNLDVSFVIKINHNKMFTCNFIWFIFDIQCTFNFFCRLAKEYIMFVLLKELLILIASLHSSAPYESCEEICKETEFDSRQVFGI